MSNQPAVRSTRSYATLAAAIVVAAVIVSATLLATLVGAFTFTKTVPETVTTIETTTLTMTLAETSTSTTRTCTLVTPDFQHCPLPLGFTDSINDGEWNYTVMLNSTSVERGQTIHLVASLTKVGNGNITIDNFVEPFINPVVYSSNGTELWSWNPPEATYSNLVFPGGQTITQSMDIPALLFQAGYNYQLTVVPDFMTIENNMTTMTLQFAVTTAL